MSRNWYLVQCKTGSHYKAKRNLTQQGFEVFLPLEKIFVQGSKKNMTQPLFSNYMFIAFDPKLDPWGKINNTYGVSKIITFGTSPSPIPNVIIKDLKNRCDNNNKLIKVEFSSGDLIKITAGTFKNFVCRIERLDQKERVWVLINLMGQQSRLQITHDKIQMAR